MPLIRVFAKVIEEWKEDEAGDIFQVFKLIGEAKSAPKVSSSAHSDPTDWLIGLLYCPRNMQIEAEVHNQDSKTVPDFYIEISPPDCVQVPIPLFPMT